MFAAVVAVGAVVGAMVATEVGELIGPVVGARDATTLGRVVAPGVAQAAMASTSAARNAAWRECMMSILLTSYSVAARTGLRVQPPPTRPYTLNDGRGSAERIQSV